MIETKSSKCPSLLVECVSFKNSNHQQKAISSEKNLSQNSPQSQEQNRAPLGAKELGGPTQSYAQSQ